MHVLKFTYTLTPSIPYNACLPKLKRRQEYYPFGMQTANSWTRDGSTNRFLYNEGGELNATSGYYDLHYRNYDATLGRFIQIDPKAMLDVSTSAFAYAGNNPVVYNDPLGDVFRYSMYEWEAKNSEVFDRWRSNGGGRRGSWTSMDGWGRGYDISNAYRDYGMGRIGRGSGNNWADGISKRSDAIWMSGKKFREYHGIQDFYGRVDKEAQNSMSRELASASFNVSVDVVVHEEYYNAKGDIRTTYEEIVTLTAGNGGPVPFDDRGWELFKRWVSGDGSTMYVQGGAWGAYMKANGLLSTQIHNALDNDARNRSGTGPVNLRFHAVIENGYFTGYEMLHGTHAGLGDFEISGFATFNDGAFLYQLQMTWHDRIDPNPQEYDMDAILSGMLSPLSPKDYDVHISWGDTFYKIKD